MNRRRDPILTAVDVLLPLLSAPPDGVAAAESKCRPQAHPWPSSFACSEGEEPYEVEAITYSVVAKNNATTQPYGKDWGPL